MNHTLGPWTFNKTIPRMVSSKQGYITRDICRMDGSTMQAFDQDANAKLIAAAPELLEALQNLLEAYSYYFPLGNHWGDMARAAITKAIGEEDV